MSSPVLSFLANDNLPSRDDIVTMCKEAGYHRRGIPFRSQPSEAISAWIKYGPYVTMAEALTQDWVAKALNADPGAAVRVPQVYQAFTSDNPDCRIGYIVMEYIDTPDCDHRDVQLVAKAVQTLISLRGPNTAPGPVGGGPVVHTFFVEWTSPITYETAEELEQHINGILKFKGDTRRINLVADARDGLRLCPCDINPTNFKKDRDGKAVALDFGATCFLPPSFFAVAMEKAVDPFAWKVAKHIRYPRTSDVAAMVSASYHLVHFGRDDIGLPKDLRQRL
ncbi:hypothetical protein BOTBODRAFT_51104 [Botryobasidium botryosum FD-172 SS1]|uniref:Aminoglycoside phosphotransferase domain-containing protein n=1 Tax=Botryobasidium botryosum (strain FD-172 SS1) TaxID=930990 RepID=A0A067MZC5_BOTB1|nr:hypothetical protein BOTBODRAFT_51104 [Botryobasidium botryosum FD-172 SS1]